MVRGSVLKWTLAAAAYEPWGYTTNKPNVDLAAGHLLYAIGWAYDLLYDALTAEERSLVRKSLERHAALVSDYFTPGPKRQRFEFTASSRSMKVASSDSIAAVSPSRFRTASTFFAAAIAARCVCEG